MTTFHRASSRVTKRAPAEYFTGMVLTDEVVAGAAPSRLRATRVSFTPGARTAWHTHPVGQVLYVLSGIGTISGGRQAAGHAATRRHGGHPARGEALDMAPMPITCSSIWRCWRPARRATLPHGWSTSPIRTTHRRLCCLAEPLDDGTTRFLVVPIVLLYGYWTNHRGRDRGYRFSQNSFAVAESGG